MSQVKVTIFEPAMCCSTGVCGPSPDKELIRISNNVRKLEEEGVSIERYNLSQRPDAFFREDQVQKLLNEKGQDVLPITMVDSEVRLTGRYPNNEELKEWAGGQNGETTE